MKRTLFLKMLFGYVLFGLAAFAVLATFTQHWTEEFVQKQEAQQLYRESNLIASSYAANYYSGSATMADFQDNLKSLSTYLDADIWIVSDSGRLLQDSSNIHINPQTSEQTPIQIEGFDVGDFKDRYYRISNFYNQYTDPVLTVFSPMTVGFQVRGYVLIHKSMDTVNTAVNAYMRIAFFSLGLFFLCSFLILGVFIFICYRPLKKIVSAADSYAKGSFDASLSVHINDEMGYLANTINYMAKELGTLEEDQRKFVSNVSHDFRSPLTSIKGYVEAMLDGTIPLEMQEKYLNIILFETERLNKLTQSLLDLNKFGHRGIRLDITDFDINQVIRTTILTFEGVCKNKGLSFDLLLTGQKLLVTGDMSKIQQVLYNLIDNAVKFSYPRTAIKIETSIKNEKVFISVKDSGVGIPADSIKKVWERFYKTDPSRGRHKQGTGLGLSIVKEIILAHDQHINVISTEEVGTEFIFTLPLSQKE